MMNPEKQDSVFGVFHRNMEKIGLIKVRRFWLYFVVVFGFMCWIPYRQHPEPFRGMAPFPLACEYRDQMPGWQLLLAYHALGAGVIAGCGVMIEWTWKKSSKASQRNDSNS